MPDNKEYTVQKQVRGGSGFSLSGETVKDVSIRIWMYPVLVVLTLLALYPAIFNDFQYEWDDQWQVLGYQMVVDPTLYNISYYFTHYVDGNYFPLNQLYYVVISRLFGFNPIAFHAGSVLIHSINTLLVYLLLNQWLYHFQGWGQARVRYSSLIIAILFAVHPLQVEAVAWISASKVLLYTLFTLLGLIAYIRFLKSDSKSGWNKWLVLLATFVCYILSLMCKEQAVIMPLNLVLVFIFYQLLSKQSPKRFAPWLHLLPFLGVALGFWYWSSQHGIGELTDQNSYDLGQRLVFGCYSLMVYIFRFLLPLKVFYFYGFPIVPGESLPLIYYSYIIVFVFFIRYLYLLWKGKKWLPLFGLLFFLINLLLALHILPIRRFMITADRYIYLSIVGIGLCCGELIRRYIWESSLRFQKIITGGLVVYVVFCIVNSNMQSRKWENSETIKKEVKEFLENTDKREEI